MKSIWKYTLSVVDGVQKIHMPKGADILSCQNQNDQITIWAMVNEGESQETRFFVVLGTGHPAPKMVGRLRFIETVQQSTGLVWHVFEYNETGES